MRKSVLLLGLAGIVLFVFQAFVLDPVSESGFPEDVESILKASCYDCHSNGASGKKPKEALNFDEWDKYNTGKKISKLADICEMAGEGKMPPEKYLNNKPEKALSKAEKELICKWVSEESAKLMEGN
jgi:hypothetical protein